MKTNQKGFASVIMIVAIVILVGVVYFAFVKKEPVGQQSNATQPDIPTSTNETVDWKIYRNERYGIEFRYPANYEVTEDDNTPGQLGVMFRTSDGQFFGFDRADHLWYIGIAKASDIKMSPVQMANMPTYSTVNPGGYTDAGGESGPYSAYWIQKDIEYYSFYFAESLELDDMQKQILTTFKFTK